MANIINNHTSTPRFYYIWHQLINKFNTTMSRLKIISYGDRIFSKLLFNLISHNLFGNIKLNFSIFFTNFFTRFNPHIQCFLACHRLTIEVNIIILIFFNSVFNSFTLSLQNIIKLFWCFFLIHPC